MALPLLRYRVWRSEWNLRRLLDPLITTWDADWAGFMGASVRDMPFDLRIPPLETEAGVLVRVRAVPQEMRFEVERAEAEEE